MAGIRKSLSGVAMEALVLQWTKEGVQNPGLLASKVCKCRHAPG